MSEDNKEYMVDAVNFDSHPLIKYRKPFGVMPDHVIEDYCKHANMIVPFVNKKTNTCDLYPGAKVPSYGLSSCGYDIRLAPHWKKYKKMPFGQCIDVLSLDKTLDEQLEKHVEGFSRNSIVLEPGELVLSHTIETFNMPSDVFATCIGKSTWARLGVHVLVTPLEPGWSGQLVVEITNTSSVPIKVYAGVGIAQLVFTKIPPPTTPYGEGKYQNQTGTTNAKL